MATLGEAECNECGNEFTLEVGDIMKCPECDSENIKVDLKHD